MISKRNYCKILTLLTIATLAGCNGSQSLLKLPSTTENSSAAIAATPESWKNAQLLHTLSGHSTGRLPGIRFLTFSADGQRLISLGFNGDRPGANGSYQGSIKIWNPQTGALVRTVSNVFDENSIIALSPNRKTLVSWSREGSLKLRELESGKILRSLSMQSEPGFLLISQDGQTLITETNNQTIQVWNLGTGKVIQSFKAGHSGSITKAGLSPDGRTLATTGLEKTIKLWQVNGKLLRSFNSGNQYPLHSLVFSRDGKTLASGSADGTIKLWDWSSGKLRQTLTGHSETIVSIAFSPQGNVLAGGNGFNRVKLWDLGTNKVIRTLAEGTVTDSASDVSVTFSPDAQMVASGTHDGKIQVWRVAR